MEIADLQHKFPLFSYDSFELEIKDRVISCSWKFTCGEYIFRPTIQLTSSKPLNCAFLDHKELSTLVFHLGLAEIPSYWKAFCSPNIEVKCGFLSDEQVKFWQKLFYHGMGEFFYLNSMKPFAPEFKSQGDAESIEVIEHKARHDQLSVLIPIGGGKDSVVTLELLAEAGYKLSLLSGNLRASDQIIEIFKKNHLIDHDIRLDRQLDPKLFDLNKAGHPNGHTPFSSMLAFVSLLCAVAYDIPFIALSNENSANEETLLWNGIAINHQYSKSYEFEVDFRMYCKTISEGLPDYFSFLRPIGELQIVKLFKAYTAYHLKFRSCNVGQREGEWCGKCGKCVFVALLLSAFLSDNEVHAIFGRSILQEKDLSIFVDQLIGEEEAKPFECVGTRTESQVALLLAIGKREKEGKVLPALLALYEQYVNDHQTEIRGNESQVFSLSDQHQLKPEFFSILKKAVEH